MFSSNLSALESDWQEKTYQFLLQGNYIQAANLYEQAIECEPSVKSHYWQLGLMLLLQGQEAEAQTTWLLGMAEGEAEEIESWTHELIEVLQTEADRQRDLGEYKVAWAIRQHIREINPKDINNLLHSIGLSTMLETYSGEELIELGVIELLKSESAEDVDFELLMQVLKNVLDRAPLYASSFDLTEACINHVKDTEYFQRILVPFVYDICHCAKQAELAARFTELALRLSPKDPELLGTLSSFYQDCGEHSKAIETAKLYYSLTEGLANKIYANFSIVRALMGEGGRWEEVCLALETLKLLLTSILAEQPTSIPPFATVRLYISVFFFPYVQDRAQENIQLRRQVSQLVALNIENYRKDLIEKYRQPKSASIKINTPNKRLKIGYLSHCLRNHSVGWLARWVFEYRDRDRFEVSAYLFGSKMSHDNLEDWYVSKVDKAYKLGIDSCETAEKIYEDEIDILVDLDSITISNSCEILAVKPAPVQVTWLGWDASCLPNIDYYIADPYVLPEAAQDYYQEKIWRLPQTYIAVDGFELGIPTLRRDKLDIGSDAVIYLSAQRGYKYNPHTARLQLRIIKEVPNSYFLVKGLAEQESLKRFFLEVAESEGVAPDRLRFLQLTGTEGEHRANLGIADVVLDTYPYNGATTTMETLWMGVPMVTRVGEQFAARNSYTMMMNAGISEGIAWTDEEYVEWGIRLGKDAVLRQQISWKLRQSRQTAPLWNGKQFTRELEKAYEQMWQIYVEKNH
ncbi:O-linked N-acetylglucosamine transferase, SPINDLY family protein [Tychonema sp. LEGE 06208]|uniref:O-linked N-acetylglucosamine transferase, SPINDLY family protein n=1 Tax=Tychonema sp. LEGE 06208 TaxID=1828663 RepID=UPI00187F2364|nr:O-linked N-acetylglucosamine transferase, SPINDLY family protein [Tychonema sp. LEGE 06208]MBE9163753.1 O-linked N-acetylglucosamine transferase, SPINDLY family protein [Tychonema sp. LEGE 06208]